MAIVVDQVTKRFIARGQEVHALQPTSMTIKEGEFVAFVGPSGCGKSTLLNMIACRCRFRVSDAMRSKTVSTGCCRW